MIRFCRSLIPDECHRAIVARRLLAEATAAGVVGFGSLARLAADSLAVLRPRLPAVEATQSLRRAFGYAGRPYNFEFDFRTDAALVCTEVVCKAYEPASGMRGLRWAVPEVLGRPVLPPNDMVQQFGAAHGGPTSSSIWRRGARRHYRRARRRRLRPELAAPGVAAPHAALMGTRRRDWGELAAWRGR